MIILPLFLGNHTPSSDFPRLSYLFLIPGLASLVMAVYFAAQFWVGTEWDGRTGTGNIMYHDPINFAFVLMMLCFVAICVLKFMLWHGPFKSREP